MQEKIEPKIDVNYDKCKKLERQLRQAQDELEQYKTTQEEQRRNMQDQRVHLVKCI
jgi:hypothetical protein